MERRLARLSHTLRTVGRCFPSGCSGFSGLSCSRQLGWRAASPSCLPALPVLSGLPCLSCSRQLGLSCLLCQSCLVCPCLSCSRQLGWRAAVRKILTTENLEFNISKTGFRPSEARFFMLSRHKNTVPPSKTVYLALQNSQSYAPKQSVSYAKIVNLTRQDSQSYAPKQPVFRSLFLYTPHTQRLTQNAKYSA